MIAFGTEIYIISFVPCSRFEVILNSLLCLESTFEFVSFFLAFGIFADLLLFRNRYLFLDRRGFQGFPRFLQPALLPFLAANMGQ